MLLFTPPLYLTKNKYLIPLGLDEAMRVHLIYCSTATQVFTDSDLLDLLAKARAKNARLGITGMLLHTNGMFF